MEGSEVEWVEARGFVATYRNGSTHESQRNQKYFDTKSCAETNKSTPPAHMFEERFKITSRVNNLGTDDESSIASH